MQPLSFTTIPKFQQAQGAPLCCNWLASLSHTAHPFGLVQCSWLEITLQEFQFKFLERTTKEFTASLVHIETC